MFARLTRWSIADPFVKAQITVISYGTGPLVTDSEAYFLVIVLHFYCSCLSMDVQCYVEEVEYYRVCYGDKPPS